MVCRGKCLSGTISMKAVHLETFERKAGHWGSSFKMTPVNWEKSYLHKDVQQTMLKSLRISSSPTPTRKSPSLDKWARWMGVMSESFSFGRIWVKLTEAVLFHLNNLSTWRVKVSRWGFTLYQVQTSLLHLSIVYSACIALFSFSEFPCGIRQAYKNHSLLIIHILWHTFLYSCFIDNIYSCSQNHWNHFFYKYLDF